MKIPFFANWNILKLLMKFLIHTNSIIALSAVVLILGHFQFFGLNQYLIPCMLLGLFATLLDYNLHRLVKSKLNIGDETKSEWVRRNFILTSAIVVLAFIGIIGVLLFLPEKIVYVFLVLAFVSFLYSFPYSFFGLRKLDIRRIPGFKNILLALVWSALTVYIPWLSGAREHSPGLMYALTETFLFILAVSISFDLRDMEEDVRLELKTLPIILGVRRAKVVRILTLVAFVSTGWIEFFQLEAIHRFMAITATTVVAMIVFLSGKLSRQTWYYPVYVDGVVLFYGLALASVNWLCL